MKQDLTELVFILDRSGSMNGLEKDTIGGFNAMLERQRSASGEALVTTVLFDDEYELLNDRVDLRSVKPMTEREYFVRGSTALYDAIGRSIERIDLVRRCEAEDRRPGKTLFAITTDGMENASREYSLGRVREMIEDRKARFGWEFLFLGANIDAVGTARSFGIDASRAANFHADSAGVELSLGAVSDAISAFRKESALPSSWKASVDQDFNRRKPDRRGRR